MQSQNIGEILENSQRFYRKDGSKNSATNISIELPEEVTELITGNDYWRKAKENRYKKLVREGHLNDLLELANLARKASTREHPSHWFARAASKAQWERTLTWLAKARRVAQDVAEVAKRLVIRPEQMKAVYKACWRRGDAVRHAITAEEIGTDKFKYFCWLVWKT